MSIVSTVALLRPSTAVVAWSLVAATATAAGVAVLLPRPSTGPWAGRGGRGRRSAGQRPEGLVDARPGRRRTEPAAALLGGALVAGAVLAAGLPGPHLAVLLTATIAGAAAARLAANGARARAAAARRRIVIDYCEALVGELRAGQPVLRAVERSVEVWPESAPVARAAALGADVPAALRRLGRRPGAAGVVRLAGAWELCAATGAGLSFAAEQVLATARAEEATDRLVQAELASARATARLVTILPVVVLAAAQGIGARPWSFLLSTGPGVICLATGVALALTGLWWIDRIAAAATGGT